jgi:uncharacterized SAM-binding protein YcdF (DUF218 family)
MVSMRTFVGRLARGAVFCLAATGLLMVLVTFTPVVAWYARALSGNWIDGGGEVLIGLGAGTVDGTTLDAESYWRATYTGRAWQRGGFREVVVAGQGVAPLMRDFLIGHGVPAAAIRVEDASGSTRENALCVKRQLAGVPGRKVLVTSDYHMFRARRAFEKAGLPVVPDPFPDALKGYNHLKNRWGIFINLGVESVKIGYYWMRGWI